MKPDKLKHTPPPKYNNSRVSIKVVKTRERGHYIGLDVEARVPTRTGIRVMIDKNPTGDGGHDSGLDVEARVLTRKGIRAMINEACGKSMPPSTRASALNAGGYNNGKNVKICKL